MRSSNSAARAYGTRSPPVNITRNEDRSTPSSSGELSIMMNWLVTAASTVTRCRSMSRSVSPASNPAVSTVGKPYRAGTMCALHSPNP